MGCLHWSSAHCWLGVARLQGNNDHRTDPQPLSEKQARQRADFWKQFIVGKTFTDIAGNPPLYGTRLTTGIA
jgi:hypothetical protein